MILVVSDIHFGVEPTSDARETTVGMEALLDYIQSARPKKLIFLGDIFDIYRCDVVEALDSGKKKFFSRLDTILSSFPCSIVYVIGNHDHVFRQAEYLDKTLARLGRREAIGEIDSDLITTTSVSLARKAMRLLLPHATRVQAVYPFHLETISGKTFFFEHGDYTDYLFFLEGGWERYLSPLLRKEAAQRDLPHTLEYLESVASIRNTASYYQKIEEHLHASLESLQRNMVVDESRRALARFVLASASLLLCVILPVFLWMFGIEDILLGGYFFALGLVILLYLTFRERFVQRVSGVLITILLDAFGPSRGERVEELVAGRLSSRMFHLGRTKNYIELLNDRAGKKIDFYVFGHTHSAGATFLDGVHIYNTGCWSVPNGTWANRMVERIIRRHFAQTAEQLAAMAEQIADWRDAKTLLLIREHEVSLLSLRDMEEKCAQSF